MRKITLFTVLFFKVTLFLCAVLFFNPQKIHAERFSISYSRIDSLTLVTLSELIATIPGLNIRAADGTDFIMVSDNGSSVLPRHIQICLDGIPMDRFHDNSLWPNLRPILNKDIGRIEILTGPDKYDLCDNCDAAINIVPISFDSCQTHLYAKSYVGSEIGDPMLYLTMLPKDSLPYNKEQIGAGEISVGLKTSHSYHGLSFSPHSLDRYSEHQDSLRYEQFDSLNLLSMNEVQKIIYTGHFRAGSFSLSGRAWLSNYTIFRYNLPANNYFHFDGRRTGIQSTIKGHYGKDKRILTILSYQGFTGEAIVRKDIDTGYTQLQNSYFVSVKNEIKLGQSLVTGIVFRREMNRKLWQPSGKVQGNPFLCQFNSRDEEPPVNMEAYLHTSSNIVNIAAGYAPGLRVWGETALSNHGIFSWALSTKKGNCTSSSFWEHNGNISWKKQFFKEYSATASLYGRSLQTYRLPLPDSDIVRYLLPGGRKTIWGCSLFSNASKAGWGSFFISPYSSQFFWENSISWNGLNLRGSITWQGSTQWERGGIPVTRKEEKRNPQNIISLEGYVTACLAGTYGLFNDRIRLSIAVYNIGKQHREVPFGSIIGPTVITSLRIKVTNSDASN